MTVAAITEVEADSPRAHFINVVKTAGGLARLGHRVLLLCRAPAAGEPAIAAAYGEPALEVLTAPPHSPHSPHAAPADLAAAFARWAARTCERRGVEFAYARSFAGALECAARGLTTVLETHAYIGDPNPMLAECLRATARPQRPLAALVTISPRLAGHYVARGADPRRVRVVPDGVDVDLFTPPGRREAWGIDPLRVQGPDHAPPPVGCARVLYSGHLYDHKGLPTLIDAAAMLEGVTVHLVGGTGEDIARARERAARAAPGRIVLHGMVPHAEVPRYLWHADALVLPPSAREASAAWTSPVKLGEYLASGRPIVASDIPGLREWVAEPAVRWFRPDDAADLARAVRAALAEPEPDGARRRAAAAALAAEYSYANRAAAILSAAGLPPRPTA